MCEIEYRNRTISQLVSELNSLGEPSVLVRPIEVVLLSQDNSPLIRLFRSNKGELFLSGTAESDKKYPYTRHSHSLEQEVEAAAHLL